MIYNELAKSIDGIQYLVIGGSRAYGTATETSDTDIRGFYLPPPDVLLGIFRGKEVLEQPPDTVLFSFHKFMSGLAKCNPNYLEILGVPEECILYQSTLAKKLRNHIDVFLTKRAFYTFSGYANSHLKALEDGAISHRDRKNSDKFFKHLSHLIRLYYTGIDLLKGKLLIQRPEREVLRDIRLGKYKPSDLFKLRATLEQELHSAYENSKLPESVDVSAVNKLTASLILETLKCE